VRRVAAVHDNTDYGRPLAETFVSTVERAGQEVVLVEAIELGQRAFEDTVARLNGAACDLVFFGLTEIESSFLVRELRAAAVGAHFFGADGGRLSPFPQLAGEAANGCYETYAGVDPATSAQAQDFVEAYEKRYGRCPIFGPEAYDAACILLEALRRGGVPDRTAVLTELRVMEGFVGATGRISFEGNGNRRDAEVTIWQVVNGEMTLLS
jgi:branched-chain amino acid transport system substrate-binding protein